MLDMLVMALGVFLRIGIPVLVVVGVGYLIVKYLKVPAQAEIQAPPEAAGLDAAAWAKAITVPPAVPCWIQNNCDDATREKCPAFKRSHVPCCLAVQVAEGKLHSNCVHCAMFRLEQDRRPPYLRAIKKGTARKVA